MSSGGASRICVVAILAPGPGSRSTVVLAADTPQLLALPTVELPAEPQVPVVLAAVEELLGQPVTALRVTTTAWEEDSFDTTGLVVEVEELRHPLPTAFSFCDLGRGDAPQVHPVQARGTVADWLEERETGWSALRPAWSRPGWLARAGAWMVEQMAEAGYSRPEPARIHYMWGFSVVLASEAAGRTAYLKCSGPAFPHEAVLTRALSEHSAGRLPDVVAVEPDAGWLLMAELPGPELGERPESEWGAGLEVLADLQRGWLGRVEELLGLGVRARPLGG